MDSDSEDSVTFSTIGGNLDFDFEDDDLGLFIGLVARSPLGRLSLKLKESVETVKGLLRAEHLTSPIKRQKQRLLRRLSDQQRMLLQDKIAFVLGVSYIWVTGVIFGMCPHVMPTYYAVTVIPLIALRYVLYKKKKFHYFLA